MKIYSLWKKNILVIIVATLIGVLYTIPWLTPIVENPGLKSNTFPILYGPAGNAGSGDSYFYYTYVREVLDGYLFSFSDDMAGKSTPSIYGSYFLSILVGSIAGIFRNSVSDAFFFNSTFLPMFSFMLIYLFLRRNSRKTPLLNIGFSIGSFLYGVHFLSALKTGFEPLLSGVINPEMIVHRTEISRFPNIMVTNLFLFGFGFCLWNFERSQRWKIAFCVTLGLSNLISTATCSICWCIAGVYFLLHLRQPIKLRVLFCHLFIAFIISLPGFYYWSLALGTEASKVFPRIAFDMDPNSFRKFDLKTVRNHLVQYWLFFPWVLLCFGVRKKIIASILGIALAYIAVSLLQGSIVGEKVFYRGGCVLFYTLLATTYLLSIKSAKRLIALNKRFSISTIAIFKRFKNPVAFVFACLMIGSVVTEIVKQKKATSSIVFSRYTDSQIDLFKWMKENVNKKDLLITLDFDLITHLPLYTPINTYIPTVLRSPYTTGEVLSRYLEVAKKYGVSSKVLIKTFSDMTGHPYMQIDQSFYDRQLRFMQLGIFYAQKVTGLSEADLHQIKDQYMKIAPNTVGAATHLLIGPFERMLGVKVFESQIVYQNNEYILFRL